MPSVSERNQETEHPFHLLEAIAEVPESYLWRSAEEAEEPVRADGIPLIDLAGTCSDAVNRLREACRDFGAFQIVNHSVDQDLIRRMEEQSRRIFALPLHKKLQVAKTPESLAGYGAVPISKFSRKLVWAEGFTFLGSPIDIAVELWPSDHTQFCATVEEYNAAMLKLATKLMRLVLESLGCLMNPQNQKYNWCNHSNGSDAFFAALRLNHYPPSPQPKQTVGMAEHTDSTFLTILDQGSSISSHSLQIRQRDGSWVAVPSVPGAFVVNIGDLLQVVSNGRYRSARHRVASSGKGRISGAYLWGPALADVVEPLTETIDDDHPRQYAALTWKQYMQARAASVSTTTALDMFVCNRANKSEGNE